MRRAVGRKPKTSSEWGNLLRLIPGYDPFSNSDGFRFDEELASRALDFFPTALVHVKGKSGGPPFVLETWQQAVIANLFGWVGDAGERRYIESLIYVPRKNGKSLLAAGISLFVLYCDGELGAEVYCAAADRDQAALIFDVAKVMVLKNDALADVSNVYAKAITVEEIASSFKAISADANTKHGFNAHCVIVDELHAQKNRELVDVLKTSTGARKQPIVSYTTTADFHRESICNETYDYACKVRDEIVTDSRFLPVIYEALPTDDWTSEEVWAKANPNIDVSVSRDYLRRECQKAQDVPAYEGTFKRLHLNIRTEQEVRWIPMHPFDNCADSFTEDDLRGRPCFAGLDLAATQDLSSLALVFPDEEKVRVLTYYWCPQTNAEKRDRTDGIPYLTWAKQGFLTLTPGNVTDYNFIRHQISELGTKYDIQGINADPFNAIQLLGDLMSDGFEVCKFHQRYSSYNDPCKRFERLILSGDLLHDANPVFRWNVSNVQIQFDHVGNIKPSRSNRAEKIDGVVATIMALALCGNNEDGSAYSKRGILCV